MLDHTHYVPILRWKRGEKGTLKELKLDDRARLTPLIEWSRPKEVAPIGEDDAGCEPANELVTDILAHWGARPFFFDAHVLFEGYLGENAQVLKQVASHLSTGGPRPVPVHWLRDNREYCSAFASLVKRTGACLERSPTV